MKKRGKTMITSIELGDFLAHSETKLEFEKGVTIFVGENGAVNLSFFSVSIVDQKLRMYNSIAPEDLLSRGRGSSRWTTHIL